MNDHASILRSWAGEQLHPKLSDDLKAAADDIERLEAENAKLREALNELYKDTRGYIRINHLGAIFIA